MRPLIGYFVVLPGWYWSWDSPNFPIVSPSSASFGPALAIYGSFQHLEMGLDYTHPWLWKQMNQEKWWVALDSRVHQRKKIRSFHMARKHHPCFLAGRIAGIII
jgi:hypothetical protein